MKTTTVATFLGLAASTLAVAVRDTAKSDSWNQITLCNDFHGGKPCVTYDTQTGCHDVSATNAGYISSVEIEDSNEYCTFYSEFGCKGDSKHITVYYPGSKDLAVNYNFDNEILSYSCQEKY